MKLLFLLLGLLFLIGCQGQVYGSHYTVHVDPAFGPIQTAQIEEALSNWTAQTQGEATFVVLLDNTQASRPGEISFVPSTRVELDWEHQVAGRTWRYPDDHSIIRLATDAPNAVHDAEHELGHAMGLQHDVLGTVMYMSSLGAARDVTDRDVQAWRDLRGRVD